MIFVVSGISVLNACRIKASVLVSTALVESSRMRIFGFFSSARAIQSLCFWPPEKFAPPCSTFVSNPSGSVSMNSSAFASLHARAISSSVASGFPHLRLSRMVPENSTFFCKTIATASRRVVRLYSRTFTPPTRTSPFVVSYNRGISCTRVDFALPVPPRIPTVSPDRIFRLMSLRISCSASFVYWNPTSRNSTLPSATVKTGSDGLVKSTSSSSTSAILRDDACAIVIMTKTMASIMRLIRICIEYEIRLIRSPRVRLPEMMNCAPNQDMRRILA